MANLENATPHRQGFTARCVCHVRCQARSQHAPQRRPTSLSFSWLVNNPVSSRLVESGLGSPLTTSVCLHSDNYQPHPSGGVSRIIAYIQDLIVPAESCMQAGPGTATTSCMRCEARWHGSVVVVNIRPFEDVVPPTSRIACRSRNRM